MISPSGSAVTHGAISLAIGISQRALVRAFASLHDVSPGHLLQLLRLARPLLGLALMTAVVGSAVAGDITRGTATGQTTARGYSHPDQLSFRRGGLGCA